MAKNTPVNAITRMVGQQDARLWGILKHYVGQARGKEDHSKVILVGVDENANKRGYNHIFLFVDMDESKEVVFLVDAQPY